MRKRRFPVRLFALGRKVYRCVRQKPTAQRLQAPWRYAGIAAVLRRTVSARMVGQAGNRQKTVSAPVLTALFGAAK